MAASDDEVVDEQIALIGHIENDVIENNKIIEVNQTAIVNAEMEDEVIQEKEERLRNSMREVSEEMDMFTKEDEIENAATKLESIKKLFIAIKTKLRDTLKLIDKPANIALQALWEDNLTRLKRERARSKFEVWHQSKCK